MSKSIIPQDVKNTVERVEYEAHGTSYPEIGSRAHLDVTVTLTDGNKVHKEYLSDRKFYDENAAKAWAKEQVAEVQRQLPGVSFIDTRKPEYQPSLDDDISIYGNAAYTGNVPSVQQSNSETQEGEPKYILDWILVAIVVIGLLRLAVVSLVR